MLQIQEKNFFLIICKCFVKFSVQKLKNNTKMFNIFFKSLLLVFQLRLHFSYRYPLVLFLLEVDPHPSCGSKMLPVMRIQILRSETLSVILFMKIYK